MWHVVISLSLSAQTLSASHVRKSRFLGNANAKLPTLSVKPMNVEANTFQPNIDLSEQILQTWSSLPQRRQHLQEARRVGIFPWHDSFDHMKDANMIAQWDEDYNMNISKLWSLGFPKAEVVKLLAELKFPEEGFTAAVLGSGLGVEVAYIAKRTNERPGQQSSVAGVDFSQTAVDHAKRDFGQTPGASFYLEDVSNLKEPSVPLDLVIDNTVFQNMYRQGQQEPYLKALTRISKPGHTVLNLNLMSKEGVEGRKEFKDCLRGFGKKLPLTSIQAIKTAFSADWQILRIRESIYDLDPAAHRNCDVFERYGKSTKSNSTGIPSWSVMLLRK